MAKKYKRYVSQSLKEQTDANAGTGTVAATAAPRRTGAEFNPDYGHIVRDLKRIGILAGTFITVLIVLSFILN